MMFGGDRIPEDAEDKPDPQNYTMTVSGMQNPNALLFSLFRLTLVDDYDYDVSILTILHNVVGNVKYRTCHLRHPHRQIL